jgi:hypothetical protein
VQRERVGALGGGDALQRRHQAGAYAMPALIRAFTAGASSSQELMAERAILNIGRNAVLPLCESLNGLPAGQQVRVIRVLGELGSKIAAPWIASVANAKGATSDVRQAASEAMSRMGVSSTDQNALWTSMARSFIVGAEGLLPYPAEMQQPTWRFDGDHGLMPKMVSTGVYCDIMAQRCALQAMNSDAGNGTALAVYLAAGLRLEAQETATEVASPLSPSSLVQAAGPMVGRQVLGLGVEIGDAGLQLQAIRALSKTGGPTTLVSGSEQNPLIACLDSANRRVRVEAALAVARAMPSTSFPRADAVVPTLAATLREGGHLAAGVVAMQAEDRTQIESWLRAQGFDVMGSTESASALRTAMTGLGSADLVVVAGDPTFVSNQGRALRGDALTSSAMLLLAVPEQDAVRVDRSLRDSRSANVWFLGSSGETFNGAVKVLMNRASGGMPKSHERCTPLGGQAAAGTPQRGAYSYGVDTTGDAEKFNSTMASGFAASAVSSHAAGMLRTKTLVHSLPRRRSVRFTKCSMSSTLPEPSGHSTPPSSSLALFADASLSYCT